ncbi:MAG TPA: heparinase II/III family protein [Bacilli bacterium]
MRIADKITTYGWCARSIEQLKTELDHVFARGVSIPAEPGGWWHQYVCPEHHTELRYDPAEDDARVFHCPYGCRLTDDKLRGAWLVFKHQETARNALGAAAVYAATADVRYAELAKTILVRYAEQYPRYPVHPGAEPWMLKGRAFQQALTEAIWACTLLRTMLLLRDEGIEMEKNRSAIELFLAMLEDSMTRYRHILIVEKNNPENNYTAWLNAALSCIYAFRDERGKLSGLIEGPGGFRHHLTVGVKPDHFEFEGSVYYHIFVLRAYLIAAEMSLRLGVDLYGATGADGQTLRGMFRVLTDLADVDGRLPALHDGPYRRVPYAREIAEVFEIGLARYRDGAFVPILEEAYRQLYGKRQRNGLEAAVFAEGEWPLRETAETGETASRWLAESGFAIGKRSGNPLSFIIDFGPHGGSHGHYDKLNLVLNHAAGVFAPERGMVPYGSAMRHNWYASTPSHNTVAVEWLDQRPHEGKCRKFAAASDYTYVWAESDQAYEGCVMSRHLWLNDQWLLDWFTVEAERELSPVDWFLHWLPDAGEKWEKVRQIETWRACGEPPGKEAPYSFISAVSQRTCGRKFEQYDLTVRVGPPPKEGRERGDSHDHVRTGSVTVSTLLFPGTTAYQIRSPGTADDPTCMMGGLLLRGHGKKTQFIAVYQNGVKPPVLRVSTLPGGETQLGIATDRGTERFVLRQDGLARLESEKNFNGKLA